MLTHTQCLYSSTLQLISKSLSSSAPVLDGHRVQLNYRSNVLEALMRETCRKLAARAMAHEHIRRRHIEARHKSLRFRDHALIRARQLAGLRPPVPCARVCTHVNLLREAVKQTSHCQEVGARAMLQPDGEVGIWPPLPCKGNPHLLGSRHEALCLQCTSAFATRDVLRGDGDRASSRLSTKAPMRSNMPLGQ